jgi:tRNA A-37 threonylcarbamoyl transferase component Bud32/tetratricopeptide (TPR) repeat protein
VVEAGDLSGLILDDRYQVIGPIGEGAMGSVYRAERLKLGRIVAIKVMNARLPDGMSSRRRFEREATTMAKLEHPHCASVLDIGVHDSRPYVVMDFVSGTNLTKLIDEGPVPIARAVEITRQVLSGLAHAHELGIVHRDIKPANIVLSQKAGLGDHVKILDFGLARLSEESSNLTAGVILGTPSYMAPEQIRGILIDGRADLYACGVTLFELLTGTKPFRSEGNDPLGICMMHINVPAPRLADVLPGHDFGALEQVIARALEKDRDRRFATAGEFATVMSEAIGRPSAQTPPAGVTVALPAGPRPATAPPARDVSALASAATSALTVEAVAPPKKDTSALASAATSALTVEAIAPPPGRSSPSATPTAPRGRRVAIGGAIAAVVVIGAVAAIVIGTRGGAAPAAAPSTSPPVAIDPAGAAPAEAPRVEDPAADLIGRAKELAGGGRLKPAIDLLAKARKTYPQDGRLPYHAGLIYLDKMYFADGLPLVRAAIALDPAYRSDDTLIKLLVRGFNATASYDGAIARFLRDDIGVAAKPYLEETAKSHPNPIVRNRAAAELRRY